MGIVGRNKSFLITALLILVIGALIFGGVTVVRVMAEEGDATAAAPEVPPNYNSVDSFGITGYAPLTITDTPDTPGFVSKRLKEQRGMVVLVYVKGAAADMEMLQNFNAVKEQYAADASFFNFEAHDVTETGNLLDQLKVSDPPVLAIIDGAGKVSELYTGWVDQQVLEQRVADAVRGY
jgi:hypothetical protein